MGVGERRKTRAGDERKGSEVVALFQDKWQGGRDESDNACRRGVPRPSFQNSSHSSIRRHRRRQSRNAGEEGRKEEDETGVWKEEGGMGGERRRTLHDGALARPATWSQQSASPHALD